MKHHILIADADEMTQAMIAFLVRDNLSLRATQVRSGKEMHAALKKDLVNLVVLNLTMPDEEGLALARQIRARSSVPIIAITEDPTKETRIAALEVGINDIVSKPFDPYEVQLRIRNHLRHDSMRHDGKGKAAPQSNANTQLRFGDFELDINQRSLNTVSGDRIHLTPNEFNILAAMVKRVNKVMSRSQILDIIDDGDDAPSDRAVDVYISQLRKKIEKNPAKPKIIQSVRGYGYILVQERANP